MCTLWQRLGRAARALNLVATGLFLVEPKRFDDNIRKAEERAVKRAAASKKRKEAADRRRECTPLMVPCRNDTFAGQKLPPDVGKRLPDVLLCMATAPAPFTRTTLVPSPIVTAVTVLGTPL
jgi:hypothetical protein